MLTHLSKQPKQIAKKAASFFSRIQDLDNNLANEYLRSKSQKLRGGFEGEPQIFVARIDRDYRLFYILEKVGDDQVLVALDIANHDEAYKAWSNKLKGI